MQRQFLITFIEGMQPRWVFAGTSYGGNTIKEMCAYIKNKAYYEYPESYCKHQSLDGVEVQIQYYVIDRDTQGNSGVGKLLKLEKTIILNSDADWVQYMLTHG